MTNIDREKVKSDIFITNEWNDQKTGVFYCDIIQRVTIFPKDFAGTM